MAKRALILLEGSRYNGPLYVQAALRLGLHPIVLSADPAQYDYVAAEGIEAIRVDTTDLDALICECSRLHATYDIAGITSVGDSFYATVGKLCRRFGLPGPNPTFIEQCCDKFKQRQLLADAGVPIPAYRLAADAAEVESFAAEIGLPVIVKPAVGAGSRGVRLCSSFDELAEHTTYLLGGEHSWQSPPRILVEEFAQGPSYWADAMGDQIIGIGTTDYGPLPHFVSRECTFPAPLTDHEHQRIVDLSRSCLRALDLGWGPSGVEFRWTTRGPIVIEVNPRLHGAGIPQMVQLAYGIDLVNEHIKLVVGEKWNLHRRRSQTAAMLYLIPDRDGTLDWIRGDSRAAAIPGVAEVKLYVEPKTPIGRKGDLRDIIGYVIAASPSHDRTEAILRRAVDLIDWSITSLATPGEQEQPTAP